MIADVLMVKSTIYKDIYCYGNVIQNRPLVRSQPLPINVHVVLQYLGN